MRLVVLEGGRSHVDAAGDEVLEYLLDCSCLRLLGQRSHKVLRVSAGRELAGNQVTADPGLSSSGTSRRAEPDRLGRPGGSERHNAARLSWSCVP